MRKYFDSKKEAVKAKDIRTKQGYTGLHVFKMPKGSKRSGKYAVCTEIEYLNTY